MWIKVSAALALGLISAPAMAQSFQQQTQTATGAFLGARVNLSLGGKSKVERFQAGFTLAPVRGVIEKGHLTERAIGHGLSIDFAGHSQPNFLVAGVPLKRIAGLERRSSDRISDRRAGLSTGWVIVGGVVLAGAVGFALLYDSAVDNTQ